MNTTIKENTMNETGLNELNLSEMEQVNGGILPILLGVGTLALGGAIIYVYKKVL